MPNGDEGCVWDDILTLPWRQPRKRLSACQSCQVCHDVRKNMCASVTYRSGCDPQDVCALEFTRAACQLNGPHSICRWIGQEVAVLSVYDRLSGGGRRLLGQLRVAAAVLELRHMQGCFKVRQPLHETKAPMAICAEQLPGASVVAGARGCVNM